MYYFSSWPWRNSRPYTACLFMVLMDLLTCSPEANLGSWILRPVTIRAMHPSRILTGHPSNARIMKVRTAVFVKMFPKWLKAHRPALLHLFAVCVARLLSRTRLFVAAAHTVMRVFSGSYLVLTPPLTSQSGCLQCKWKSLRVIRCGLDLQKRHVRVCLILSHRNRSLVYLNLTPTCLSENTVQWCRHGELYSRPVLWATVFQSY